MTSDAVVRDLIAGAEDRPVTGIILAPRSEDDNETGENDAEEDSAEDCAARRGAVHEGSTGGVSFMEERRSGGLDWTRSRWLPGDRLGLIELVDWPRQPDKIP